MGMDKTIYIGPYARCFDSISGDPDNWAHDEIIEKTGGERLFYANGESIESPALFAANVDYPGAPGFGDLNDSEGGEYEVGLLPREAYIAAFKAAFSAELAVLESYFKRVDVVFGVIVTYS